MWCSLRKLLRNIGRVDHFVFGTGSWMLKSHEAQIIDAVLDQIDQADALKVRAQLKTQYFIDRTNKRIVTIHFDDRPNELSLESQAFLDCLYVVNLLVNGTPQKAQVTFYRGFLFSVELRKPEEFNDSAKIEVVKILRGRAKDSLTAAIDRQEHGA